MHKTESIAKQGASSAMPKIGFITLAQMIGCFLVIFGHSYPLITDFPFLFRCIQTFIYCFHMPLFVWCSGFLFIYTRQTEKYSFLTFCKRRAKRLLVPYFAFSCIGIFLRLILQKLMPNTEGIRIDSITRIFLVPHENVWGHFWFLPMLFFIGLIGYCMERLIKKAKYKRIIQLVFLCAAFACSYLKIPYGEWLGLNDIADYLWIFILGCICAPFATVEIPRKVKFSLIIVSVLCAVALFIYRGNDFIRQSPEKHLIAVLMITAVVLLCQLLAEHIHISRTSIFAQTYAIFILSWFFQSFAELITERILHLPIFIISSAMFLSGTVAPLLTVKFLIWLEKKTNTGFFSVLLGITK